MATEKTKLQFFSIVFGCDPEFFFRKGKEIVGAEIVLPKDGLIARPEDSHHSKIIIDGVQAELNPLPNTCRESLAFGIADSFKALKEHLASFKGIGIDFTQTIKLDDGDFNRLSDSSKKFGCMPSKSAYNGGRDGRITVNPETYRYRSAGGHIHIGGRDFLPQGFFDNPVRIIQMMDILVGNTCVLFDRDPGNIERRKVYGKAGEFRIPPHGVEYRTLSNFWLRSYQLTSLVMGLARHACIIVANDRDAEFLKLVDMKDVSNAINNNDFQLALRNFKKIEKLLLEITPTGGDSSPYPITAENIKEFRHFVKKGLDNWFTEDPLEHWVAHSTAGGLGFYDWLTTTVRDDMEKEA